MKVHMDAYGNLAIIGEDYFESADDKLTRACFPDLALITFMVICNTECLGDL